MRNKLLIVIILLNLFIPFIHAEEETLLNESLVPNENSAVVTTNEAETEVSSVVTDEVQNETVPSVGETQEKWIINEEYNGYKLVIEDDADLLNDGEKEELRQTMIPLTKYGNIAFKTTTEPSASASYFAENYYHNKFGKRVSGTVFLIDMNHRMIYIFSDGNNYNVITKSKAKIITDNVYGYAKREEYLECAKKTFKQINTVLDGGKISEPMRYASNIVLALVIAFFIGFLRVLKNSNIKSPTNKEVLKDCDVKLDVANIAGVLIGTHKVYVPPSSSSGGSSGGGGGGGSSGGGGGHSF